MRPRKYYTDREQKLILRFYEMGATDKEISDVLKEPRTTFLDRCNYTTYFEEAENDEGKQASLSDIVKKVKGTADLKVEESLYNQALLGKVGAIAIWLFNRKPKQWRTVQHIRHIIEETEKIIAGATAKEVDEQFNALINKK